MLPFPYTDRLAEKRRPALVISSAALHEGYGLLWLAMITSADNPRWDCDVPIQDLETAGLPAPSLVRPAKIACVEPSRVLRRAGTLGKSERACVAPKLRGFLIS